MALRSSYYGLKKKLLEKVKELPAIKSIGDGLSLNSTTGVLSATGGGGGTTVVANPEGEATTDLTKLQVESTVYGIPDITGKADITAIAPNETALTASKAYAVGEHFYKDGKYCTAKTAIASGDTFTLNTNYVEGSIATTPKYMVLYETGTANQSLATKIAAIKNVFNTLTLDQKDLTRIRVKASDDSWRSIFPYVGNDRYAKVEQVTGSLFRNTAIDVANTTFVTVTGESSGITFGDSSSVSATWNFILEIMD